MAVATCTVQVPRDPKAVGHHCITFPPLPGCAKPARTCLTLPCLWWQGVKSWGQGSPSFPRDFGALGHLVGVSSWGHSVAIVLPLPCLVPPCGGPGDIRSRALCTNAGTKTWRISFCGRTQAVRLSRCKEGEGAEGRVGSCGVPSAGSSMEPGRSRHTVGWSGVPAPTLPACTAPPAHAPGTLSEPLGLGTLHRTPTASVSKRVSAPRHKSWDPTASWTSRSSTQSRRQPRCSAWLPGCWQGQWAQQGRRQGWALQGERSRTGKARQGGQSRQGEQCRQGGQRRVGRGG